MAEKKRLPWTEKIEERARFEHHLMLASEEVASWPLWKQNIWRGGPNRPLATEVIPKPCTKPECLRNKALVQACIDGASFREVSITFSYPTYS